MIFEKRYPLHGGEFRLVSASDMLFPRHLHRSFELICATRGTAAITVDEARYTISGDECVIVFPHQHHSFEVRGDGGTLSYIFPPDAVAEFSRETQNKRPLCAKFSIDPRIRALPTDNIYGMTSVFYAICGEISSKVTLIPRTQTRSTDNVLDKILFFIDQNFASECTLRKASELLQYDYSYLSRIFKLNTGLTFNEYVNRLRVNKACYMLAGTDKSIMTVSYEVGYGSVRTLNREFLKIVGASPGKYRKGVKSDVYIRKEE